MSDFIIITDSASDLPESFYSENNVRCMHLFYTIEGNTYGGNSGQEMPYKEFYAKVRGGEMPVTSQVNPEDAKEKFLAAISDGYQNILCLSFSSGLSGTYNSCRIAAEELMEEYSNIKIIVIDSLCASLGQGLFVYRAVQMKKAGKSMEEIAEEMQKSIQNYVHIFTVDDLNHLWRGGRVSRTTAFIGSMIGIKPILYVDPEGHLKNIDKTRGRKKSLIKLVDYMESHMGEYRDKNDIVFISHGDSEEDAQFVADMVKERFGIENFLINNIGPTIGAHSGPGTIALFFIGKER